MLQIKNTLGGSGGGNPEGLYVWKKYEATSVTYLSFLGNEEFTLKTLNTSKNWDGTLEYSTDTITWNTWNGTEISSSGNNLYLRGTGNTKITGSSENYKFVFTGADTLRIACEGNIENLLDYETVNTGGHPTMANYCYSRMFKNCTSLTTAPELPATTLADYCYYSMFYGCTRLTTAPQLPAITLSSSCYQDMFNNCTSLTIAPELPANALADYCYYGMFFKCISLITAPQLPATRLAASCYREMFNNCTSLTIAPELPANALADYCYRRMFYNCTRLITLPELPATTLSYRCYYQMFSNCLNIKLSEIQTEEYQTAYRIPSSGTVTEDPNNPLDALADMFISTSGTFTGTPIINTTYYTSNTIV